MDTILHKISQYDTKRYGPETLRSAVPLLKQPSIFTSDEFKRSQSAKVTFKVIALAMVPFDLNSITNLSQWIYMAEEAGNDHQLITIH